MIATLYKDFSDSSSIVEIAAGVPIYQSLANINFEDKRIIVNGQEKTPDYIPNVCDVIIIRTIPGEAVTKVFELAWYGVTFIAGGIYNWLTKGYREQIEELKNSLNSVKESVVNLPNIKGASNSIATNKTQPYIIGEHLFTPYFLSTPYYDIGGTDGVDQYYIAVLEAGFAKQVIREIKCEEVTIKTFSPSETVPQEGTFTFDASSTFYDASSLIEIAQDGNAFATASFNKVVASEQPGVELKKLDDTAYEDLIFTLDRYAKNVSICVMINGLRAYNDDGDHISRTVAMSFQYSLDSGESWNTMISTQTITRDTLNQLRFKYSKDFTYAEVDDIESPVLIKIKSNTSKSSRTSYDQVYIEWFQSDIYDPDASAVVSSFVDAKVLDDVEADLSTMIGLKIKATASNQDALRKVNIITAGVARTWTGSAWGSTKVPTRNLAAWILESLTSPTHKASQLDDSEIDMESIGDFYTYCATNNITADLVLSDGDEKRNLLATLCDIGNCVLYKNIYDEMSIAVDAVKENAIAVLNTQNLLSFEVEKTFGRKTDGIRVSYVSRDRGYDNDSYLVMRDGVTRGADSLIRDLTATGRTDHDAIVKYARRLMAIETLRPRTIKARTGKEGIYYTPLAKVLVQHPALSNGLGSAEIKSAIIEGGYITGVELYEPVQYDSTDPNGFGVVIMAVAADYCTQIAKAYTADTDGLVYTIDFVVPILASEEIKPHPGDNLSYGYLDDGEFDTITSPMLIAESVPDDTGWLLTLVDYNEAIYDAGTIPDYTPNVTVRRTPLSVPAATNSALDDANANTHLIYELFQKNTSTTTPPTFTADADDPGELWTTAMPSISAGEYIWKLRSEWLGGIRQGLWEVARLTGEKGEQGSSADPVFNLLQKAVFTSDLSRGDWNAGTVVPISGESGVGLLDGYTHALKIESRDTVAASSIFPVSPGETIYVAGWVNTVNTPYPILLGMQARYNGSPLLEWDMPAQLAAGSGWTYITGSFTTPLSGVDGFIPYIILSGSSGFGSALVQGLFWSRAKPDVKDGIDGADGADGAAGIDARGVALTADVSGVAFDTAGNTPSPATINLTATASNTSGTVYYEFFANDVSLGSPSTTATKAYSMSGKTFENMPLKFEVQIREGSAEGAILARDQLPMVGTKAGSNSITPQFINAYATVPSSTSGIVSSYDGTGGTLKVLEGNTALIFHTTLAAGRFIVGTPVVSPTGKIAIGARSGSGTDTCTIADHSAMSADKVTITYPITAKRADGNDVSFDVIQKIEKSKIASDGWTRNFVNAVEISPGEFRKISGSGDLYDASVYSSEAYTSCFCSAQPRGEVELNALFGLNDTPASSPSYLDIDYCWFAAYLGLLEIYESGVSVGTFGSYASSTVLSITYNGSTIQYLKDGVVVRTTTASGAKYFDSSFRSLDSSAGLKNVHFGPMGEKGIDGADGAEGPQGESSLGLVIKKGYSDFSTPNDGECFICGTDTYGVAQNVDGYIYFDDVKKIVTKGAINPDAGMDGHILIPVAGGSPFAAYFKISNQSWYSVIAGTESALTEANYLAIGEFVNTAAEVTESASLYPRAKRLTEIRNAIKGACLGIAASVTTGSGAVSIHQVTSGPYAFTASGVTRRARPGDCVFVRGGTATTGIGDTVKAIRVFDGRNWDAPRAEDYQRYRGLATQAICDAQNVYQLNGVTASADFDAVFNSIFSAQVLAARVDALEAFITSIFATDITASGTITGGALVGGSVTGATHKSSDGRLKMSSSTPDVDDIEGFIASEGNIDSPSDGNTAVLVANGLIRLLRRVSGAWDVDSSIYAPTAGELYITTTDPTKCLILGVYGGIEARFAEMSLSADYGIIPRWLHTYAATQDSLFTILEESGAFVGTGRTYARMGMAFNTATELLYPVTIHKHSSTRYDIINSTELFTITDGNGETFPFIMAIL